MSNSPFRRCRQSFAALPLTAAISAALSTGAALIPSTAVAQLEEVVVTARARSESLQDVPATVTAFTEGQIENMGRPTWRRFCLHDARRHLCKHGGGGRQFTQYPRD